MKGGDCTTSRPAGVRWSFHPGGGAVAGHADPEGRLSGDDIAYVYPDYRTALVGTFADGVLVSAQAATVTSLTFEKVFLE